MARPGTGRECGKYSGSITVLTSGTDAFPSAEELESAVGFFVEKHRTVGSTNTKCFERAREQEANKLWVIADEQTQGRGRRGREWHSPSGNLYASLLLVDVDPAERVGELPLLAAVALAEAVEETIGAFNLVKLKWPNDLLVDGAKLAGILLEAERLADGRQVLAIGFGVNCSSHPMGLTLYDATDLRSLGYAFDIQRLFNTLAAGIAQRLEDWRQPGGFRNVRQAWVKRSAHLGKAVTVVNGSSETTGIFRDLDESGHLVLQLDNAELKTFYAGDVFLSDNAV